MFGGVFLNILFLVRDMKYSNGGVCTHILALSRELIFSKNNIYLISDGSDYDNEIKNIGIKYIDNIKISKVKKNPLIFIKVYNSIKKVCKNEKIDIIHVHTQSALPIAFLIKKKLNIPYIWTNHINDIPKPKILKLFHSLFKFPIISVSISLKQDLINRFSIDEKYITVIPNGIELNNFSSLSYNEEKQFKIKYRIDDDYFNICILSRVARTKGHDILVKAINNVQKSLHDKKKIKLTIAGSIIDTNWFQTEVVDYSKNNDILINYVGFASAREIFGICDLSVLPSRMEGFGMVCIESLAMKCPVIRSNSPGWEEMHEFCDVSRIDDIASLSNSIISNINDGLKLQNKCLLGYDAVQKKFNSVSMALLTSKAYEKIKSYKL
jgi:glycosyltransferase involved in cell wall biosynthesis